VKPAELGAWRRCCKSAIKQRSISATVDLRQGGVASGTRKSGVMQTQCAAVAPLPFDPRLIAKYDGFGPRYTSYPTADRFNDDFRASHYASVLHSRNTSRSLRKRGA